MTLKNKARYSSESKRLAGCPDIAVLIPCYNEGASIGQVVSEFHAALPNAVIYVYDNNSTDDTCAAARAAGAVVRHEPLQGKGNVVRRMFADIEAEVYVLVDGDATYDATCAAAMIDRLLNGHADMINGARKASSGGAYRRGHRFGNVLLSALVGWIFGKRIQDILSGYKIFSRRFVKSFPALSRGFEIETELAVHALELRMPIAEVETSYKKRSGDSESKLNTFSDGLRILRLIVVLTKEERPLAFFIAIAVILVSIAVGISLPLLSTYLETGLVPRFPTAILATGLVILAFLSVACGLVLDTVTRGRQELKRMFYLSVPSEPTRTEHSKE